MAQSGARSHIEKLCFHGESVSVLTSLKVALNQDIVTGKRFVYIMRGDYESLSAGEVSPLG
jgi:hypothetical protein